MLIQRIIGHFCVQVNYNVVMLYISLACQLLRFVFFHVL